MLARTLQRASHLQMLARHYERPRSLAQEAKRMAVAVRASQVAQLADAELGTVELVMGVPSDGVGLLRDIISNSRASDHAFRVVEGLMLVGSGAGEVRL